MKFIELKEFLNEFKKLSKKYKSLEEDFKDFKLSIEDDPTWKELPSEHIVNISWLGDNIDGDFYKVRRFFCKSLKSKWDLRIVYKFSNESNSIEFCEIEFIEIFHKNTKENHDIKRIKKYYSK